MQRCGVDLHQHPGGHPEGFDLGGVQHPILNLILFGKKENEILRAQIKLAVPVVFQAIEPRIVAVAPPKLHWHTAVAVLADLHRRGQLLQFRIRRDIAGGFRQGCFCQGFQYFFLGLLQTFHDLTVGLKFRVKYRIDVHIALLLFMSAPQTTVCRRDRFSGTAGSAAHTEPSAPGLAVQCPPPPPGRRHRPGRFQIAHRPP